MRKLSTKLTWALAGLLGSLALGAAAGGYNPAVLPVSTEGQLPTYSAAIVSVTPAATPTDVFCVQGTAAQTVKVSRVEFMAVATAAGTVDALLVKRISANTGAASSVPVTTHDSAAPSTAATVVNYLANPSALGTGTTVRAAEVPVTLSTASSVPSIPFSWNFGTRNSQYVVLHGVGESLCLNMNGSALPTGTAIYVGAEFLAY